MARRPTNEDAKRRSDSAGKNPIRGQVAAQTATFEDTPTAAGRSPEQKDLKMETADTEEIVSSFTLSKKRVNQYAWTAFGAGFLPSLLPGGPVLDFAGVLGVQVMLIKHLADGYGIPFSKDLAKEMVGLLTGSLGAAVGYGSARYVLPWVPYIGPVLGFVVAPGFNYLSTYAVGRVFDKHFASGGTFLDLDPESLKKRVLVEYNEARAALKESKAALRDENVKLRQRLNDLESRLKSETPAPAVA